MVLKMERWYCSRSIPSIMSKTEASPLSTHPFLSQRTPKFKKMRSDIWLTGIGIHNRVPVYGRASRLRADPLQPFWIPRRARRPWKQPKIPTSVREKQPPVWCDHAVTHTYHTPVSTMTIATSMLDHSANAMESDAVLPKDVDGTPRLLITKMVRPLDCAGVTSRQRTMMNEISNPFYPTIVFVIRNWKTLKVMREQKSLVRSTNVSVPWLARTAVGNQTSSMQCCSSLANVHRSCDSRKYQN